ncbi:zinc knuckle CX2CX4HX4C containing protein [Tanacetum coccineum]|uniref:Zinc knuckle CX2CX4HX4C containing protein n=1 Tax=Tanacetum coccineum TaxID=301880 RepID=A0ABQ4ZU39_9ASTR
MRSKRAIKPNKIFDNSVTDSSRNKNKQKNASKKKNSVSNEINDLMDMGDVDRGSDSGSNSEDRGNENIKNNHDSRIDENVLGKQDQQADVEKDMERVRDEGCLDADKDKIEPEKMGQNFKNIDDISDGVGKSYANMVTKDLKIVDNKLNYIPTEINEEGSKVVVFDEALVDKGSGQWRLTICGNFVGYKMSVHELRRWYSMFKFKDEVGMNKVLELGPWIVNNKPLFVKKWDPTIGLEKVEQTKIPLWVKLVNVPLEAWSSEGISALASSLGRPIIMNTMTAKKK